MDGEWYEAVTGPYSTARLEPAESHPELGFTSDTMTNGMLTLRFGASGEIESCLDGDGHEHAAGGLNRLTLHRDPYQFPFDAWDIDQKYTTREPRLLRAHQVETELDGPTVRRTQRYRWGRGTIEQTIILEAGSLLVRVDSRIDWREKHRMLRADFLPVHFGETAKSEIQFGHIERVTTERNDVERAQFETCAHRWVATQDDGDWGFAVLNTGKFGHRVKDGLVSLNLLRSPTFPDKIADRGIHHVTYAFRPFVATGLSGVIKDGYRLNNPLILTVGVDLPMVAHTDHPGVIIETIKPAENGEGVILRLYESLGEHTIVKLSVSLPSARARETNLMEAPIGAVDVDRLEFTPFEIKTIFLGA